STIASCTDIYTLPLHDALPILARYLRATAGDSSDYVFLNARGGQMTRQGVWKNFKEIVRKSGLSKKITLQTLRHTFTADLLKNGDRKSTRLNSSHVSISYAVFC